jgi:hypothetical protein
MQKARRHFHGLPLFHQPTGVAALNLLPDKTRKERATLFTHRVFEQLSAIRFSIGIIVKLFLLSSIFACILSATALAGKRVSGGRLSWFLRTHRCITRAFGFGYLPVH